MPEGAFIAASLVPASKRIPVYIIGKTNFPSDLYRHKKKKV
jgi:hypothetical protein